jgi:Cohesin domain
MTSNLLRALALALLAGSASATSLSFSSGPPVVRVGDAFALDVQVDDVAGLYGFQFDLLFDPTIVRAVDVAEGPFLTSGGAATSFAPGDIDNTFGTVLFTGNTLLGPAPGASGSGVLARLTFQALAEGRSPLAFGNVVLLDAALEVIGSTAFGRSLDVAAVPEPASALMTAVGLAALAATLQGRRRRIAASTPGRGRS